MSPVDGSLSGRQPKAVQSALQVLEQVARAGVGVTAKEIAEHLSMPSATTYRLLNLLVADGYVVRLPDLSSFSLGPRMGVLIVHADRVLDQSAGCRRSSAMHSVEVADLAEAVAAQLQRVGVAGRAGTRPASK